MKLSLSLNPLSTFWFYAAQTIYVHCDHDMKRSMSSWLYDLASNDIALHQIIILNEIIQFQNNLIIGATMFPITLAYVWPCWQCTERLPVIIVSKGSSSHSMWQQWPLDGSCGHAHSAQWLCSLSVRAAVPTVCDNSGPWMEAVAMPTVPSGCVHCQ